MIKIQQFPHTEYT